MTNITKLIVVLVFTATTLATYTACNKTRVAEEKCQKECCADNDDKCKKDCQMECCNAKSQGEGEKCESACKKECCKHKNHSDHSPINDTSGSKEEAHICADNCHRNGCSHKI